MSHQIRSPVIGKRDRLCCTQEFHDQVAGHLKEPMQLGPGVILKPCFKGDTFAGELALYEDVRNSSWYLSPQAFIPKYYGLTLKPSLTGHINCFLVLEDLTRRFNGPNIVDLKIGDRSFGPDASVEKIIEEKSKCFHQLELGFRICGAKYGPAGRFVSKQEGRAMDPSQVDSFFVDFFDAHTRMGGCKLRATLSKLERLVRWLRVQTRYRFVASSLLIIHEGQSGFVFWV
jgi:1D-myo-inositol-tetrakisphosphate 5-kinase/inositol-polyphosphate multikinase